MLDKGLLTVLKKRCFPAFFLYAALLFAMFIYPVDLNAQATQQDAEIEVKEVVEIPAQPVFRTLQWKARVIVITGDYSDPMAESQLLELRGNLDGLRERDIAVIRFARDDIKELGEYSNFNYRGWFEMDANQQRFMESQLMADNNVFSVVLVGKDGGVKRVWTPLPEAPQIITVEQIFAVIDQMPMRADEMRDPN